MFNRILSSIKNLSQSNRKAHKMNEDSKMTPEDLYARLKVFVGCCLALTLMGIVFVVLFSIIFVTQPLDAISPVDSKLFELIIPIATFLTGTLSGIMLGSSGEKKKDKDCKCEEK